MLPLIGSDLRAKLPSSRARMFSRIAPFDVVWAGVSPVLAFIIRDGAIVRIDAVVLYWLLSLSLFHLLFFSGSKLARHFRIFSPCATR